MCSQFIDRLNQRNSALKYAIENCSDCQCSTQSVKIKDQIEREIAMANDKYYYNDFY